MNRTTNVLVTDGRPHERRHPLAEGRVKITTFVPLHFKKRGVKKVVVAPEGINDSVVVNESPAVSTQHDTVLIKALARGHYWQHLLDAGIVADTAEIAEREGIHRATVNEVLRLALLAPDIVLSALEGTLPRTVSLETFLRGTFPQDWVRQREMVVALG